MRDYIATTLLQEKRPGLQVDWTIEGHDYLLDERTLSSSVPNIGCPINSGKSTTAMLIAFSKPSPPWSTVRTRMEYDDLASKLIAAVRSTPFVSSVNWLLSVLPSPVTNV